MEHGHRNSGFDLPIEIVIFHSFLYVYQAVTIPLLKAAHTDPIPATRKLGQAARVFAGTERTATHQCLGPSILVINGD